MYPHKIREALEIIVICYKYKITVPCLHVKLERSSMESHCKMMGLKQDQEEINLDLGLSIGCSFKSSEKLNYTQHRMDVDPKEIEVEALRRPQDQAKRKRQEKQQMKINADNKEGECKRSRVDADETDQMQNMNLNFTVEQNIRFNKSLTFSCNQKGYTSTIFPAIRFVPFTNAVDGCVSEENRKSGSNGSPVYSSSQVSDYRSSSHEGGGSSDARSNSSHSLPEQNPLHGSIANDTNDQSEHSASWHSREKAQVYDEITNCIENYIKQTIQSDTAQFIPITKCKSNSIAQQMIPSNIVQFSPTKPKEVAIEAKPVSSESQVSNTVNPSMKESKKDMGKPPKPQSQNQNPPCLGQMPCVSTTGNGPNGKTINGFLYRYTKTELSIICVCHGSSFSPAEFVQHAGGTDVSHPLRQITVIPSTF